MTDLATQIEQAGPEQQREMLIDALGYMIRVFDNLAEETLHTEVFLKVPEGNQIRSIAGCRQVLAIAAACVCAHDKEDRT